LNASGGSVAITLTGAGNGVVDTAQNASIASGGISDVLITQNSGNNANISITGNATIQNVGASDTITASGTGKFIGYFIGTAGGQMQFINNSAGASSIIASLNPATGAISSQGSVTVSAGAGGGVYDGGISGNNSLVGGSGVVTLFSAGVNNYLYADGAATGSAYNLINAYSGGNDTLIAGSGSTNNVFFAGIGTESIASSGSGTQNFFVGTEGSETISASTVSGAVNTFIFQQAVSQGGGTDVLQNFKPGNGYINLGNGISNVTIASFENLSGVHSGTEIDLSNGTTIKLFGVASSSFNASIVGGAHF
jgi:filamentous hemagglutinin